MSGQQSAENVVPRIVWDMPQTCRLCGWDTMHDNRVCAPCSRDIPPDLNDFQWATVAAFASMTPAQRRAAINTPRARVLPPGENR